jgi:hypothetical protein
VTFRDVLAIAVPFAFTVFGFMHWRDNGYWVPRFIHIIAVIAALIGFGLVWMSYSSDAQNKLKVWSIVIVLPALVYWAFMIYGGGAGVRRFNDYLSIHASMNESEVLDLLRTYFAPYRRRNYQDLKKLIEHPENVALSTPSGTNYELRLAAETDRDNPRADVHVFGQLGEMGRKRGVPVAFVTFSKTESGVVINDGLSEPFRSRLRR